MPVVVAEVLKDCAFIFMVKQVLYLDCLNLKVKANRGKCTVHPRTL